MSHALSLRPAEACLFDLVSLGEVMLRLDPGEGRIRTARQFRAWEGGGEYNVARAIRRCFGLRSAIVTALADNEVGRLLEDLMLQGGVDCRFITWSPYDGVGRTVRNGLNFTERGFGIRGALGVSDRGHAAACANGIGTNRLAPHFRRAGNSLVSHRRNLRGAIRYNAGSGLGSRERCQTTRRYRFLRPELPPIAVASDRRTAPAQEVNREIAQHVDVMIGNEEDFTACLGLEVAGLDENISSIEVDSFQQMMARAVREFPNLVGIATTLRTVHSATVNDWQALLWYGSKFHQSRKYANLEILDRIGGGDSFASGLIYGLLSGYDPAQAVEYGAAHGALAMTTPGDTSMASLSEVEKLLSGGSARVVR